MKRALVEKVTKCNFLDLEMAKTIQFYKHLTKSNVRITFYPSDINPQATHQLQERGRCVEFREGNQFRVSDLLDLEKGRDIRLFVPPSKVLEYLKHHTSYMKLIQEYDAIDPLHSLVDLHVFIELHYSVFEQYTKDGILPDIVQQCFRGISLGFMYNPEYHVFECRQCDFNPSIAGWYLPVKHPERYTLSRR